MFRLRLVIFLHLLACNVSQAWNSVAGSFEARRRDLNTRHKSSLCCLCSKVEEESGNIHNPCHQNKSNTKLLSRRHSFVLVASTISCTSTIKSVHAHEVNIIDGGTDSINDADKAEKQRSPRALVEGKVTLKSITDIPEDTSPSALYITARPSKIDNIPRAILDGSNGKPPPVLAARFPNPAFPFQFELNELHLTEEGLVFTSPQVPTKPYWWENQDLILSARWDMDGIAATRGSTDLVGRSQISTSRSDVDLQIGGRGFTGKFVTGKSAK